MSPAVTNLYWPAAVVLMAAGQGLLLPAIRRTPPGAEAKRQAIALHYVLFASYLLPIALAPSLLMGGVALAARLLLFDPVLNLAAGDAVFAVGQTAASDRAVRGLAQRLSMQPEHLRALLWGLCLVLVGCWLLLIK